MLTSKRINLFYIPLSGSVKVVAQPTVAVQVQSPGQNVHLRCYNARHTVGVPASHLEREINQASRELAHKRSHKQQQSSAIVCSSFVDLTAVAIATTSGSSTLQIECTSFEAERASCCSQVRGQGSYLGSDIYTGHVVEQPNNRRHLHLKEMCGHVVGACGDEG